jgi:hypothetical protein
MEQSLYDKIDSVIFNTDLGKYILLASKNDQKGIEKLTKSLSSKPYGWKFHLKEQKNNIAKKIRGIVKNEDEYAEYLKRLDKKNYAAVEFMISNDILIDIFY